MEGSEPGCSSLTRGVSSLRWRGYAQVFRKFLIFFQFFMNPPFWRTHPPLRQKCSKLDEKILNYDVMNGYIELRILENIFNYF